MFTYLAKKAGFFAGYTVALLFPKFAVRSAKKAEAYTRLRRELTEEEERAKQKIQRVERKAQ